MSGVEAEISEKAKKTKQNMKKVKKSVMWLEGAWKGHSRWRNDKRKGLGWEGCVVCLSDDGAHKRGQGTWMT